MSLCFNSHVHYNGLLAPILPHMHQPISCPRTVTLTDPLSASLDKLVQDTVLFLYPHNEPDLSINMHPMSIPYFPYCLFLTLADSSIICKWQLHTQHFELLTSPLFVCVCVSVTCYCMACFIFHFQGCFVNVPKIFC